MDCVQEKYAMVNQSVQRVPRFNNSEKKNMNVTIFLVCDKNCAEFDINPIFEPYINQQHKRIKVRQQLNTMPKIKHHCTQITAYGISSQQEVANQAPQPYCKVQNTH